MIIDRSLLLMDSVSVTASQASTNYIDTLKAGPSAYVGSWMVVTVETTFTTCTSMTFDLRHDASSSFGTDTVLVSSGAVLVASLAKGYTFAVRIPFQNTLRYLRGYVTVAGSNAAAGALSMFIAKDVDLLLP
jgi:hypothetical protein